MGMEICLLRLVMSTLDFVISSRIKNPDQQRKSYVFEEILLFVQDDTSLNNYHQHIMPINFKGTHNYTLLHIFYMQTNCIIISDYQCEFEYLFIYLR
jgi:hypothetical protein